MLHCSTCPRASRARDAYTKRFGAPKRPKDFYDKLLAIGALPAGLVRRALLD